MSITKTAAARIAAEKVGMVQIGLMSYEIHTWDETRKAWIASNSTNFHNARAELTKARHAYALETLGWDRWDAGYEAEAGRGSLADRINRSLSTSQVRHA